MPRLRQFLHRRRARHDLLAARRAADLLLAQAPAVPSDLAWRVDEIVGDDNRRTVADALRRLVRSADPGRLPGASPLNRPAVRSLADELCAAADRLSDVERPVGHRGVLRLARLLDDDQGPLYVLYRAWELDGALQRARGELEPE
jgi:hypothetical protein